MSNPAKNISASRGEDLEVLWKQYEVHVGLYKFYLEQLIKLQAFYYGITGAIFTYYFSNIDTGLVNYSLLLPLFMSVALGGFFLYGARLNSLTRKDVFDIRDQLGLATAPDVGVLSVILRIFAALSFLVAVVCIYMLFIYTPD